MILTNLLFRNLKNKYLKKKFEAIMEIANQERERLKNQLLGLGYIQNPESRG